MKKSEMLKIETLNQKLISLNTRLPKSQLKEIKGGCILEESAEGFIVEEIAEGI